jgi:hypothetical protein
VKPKIGMVKWFGWVCQNGFLYVVDRSQ